MGRLDLEELQSRLYCLEAALEDTERDLQALVGDGRDDPGELRLILGWLVENARPATQVPLARTGS